jgi:hypothetical protein
MALGLGSSLIRGGASLLTFVKDNLKLYLDFKSSRSDTLAFPSEGSTEFDGNDYIDFGDISLTGEFTLACWINRDDTDSQVVWGDSANADWFRLTSATTADIKIANNSKNLWTHGATFSSNEWEHLAVVRDSSDQITIYRNGIHYTSNAPTRSGTFVPEYLGQKDSGGYFDGKMANNAIWSRSLSPEEINSVMNKSYSQLGSVEKTSLVMWQSLDSAVGGAVTPASGETLGSEIVGSGFYTLSNWVSSNTESNPTATSVKFVRGSDSQGGAIYLRSENNRLTTNLTVGTIYKITFTYTTDDADAYPVIKDSSNTYYSFGATSGEKVLYYKAVHATFDRIMFQGVSAGTFVQIADVSIKEVTSDNIGLVTGATTTTSVYGGNAPILPRAIDIAESQADAIGNGSASFNGSSDYVDVGSDSLLDNIWTGGGTLSAWIYPRSSGEVGFGMIVSKRQSSTGYYVGMHDESGGACDFRFVAYRATSSRIFQTTSREVLINAWNHVLITYDSDVETNAPLMYINGTSVAITASNNGTGAYDDASNTMYIGGEAGGFTFDGFISQLGIWKGLLSQEMVQSLIESTSYAKIPADVKSTLGAERVLNSDFSDGENLWTLNNANVVNEVLEIDEGAFSYYAQQSVDGGGSAYRQFESGYLMKLEIVVDEYTSGGTIIYATGNNIGTFNSAGTHTIYYKPSATEYLRLRSNGEGFEGKISSISIKRVTNDLVAYYPLDADSSANGVTNDVTTGEVLGDELALDGGFDTDVSAGGSSDDWLLSSVTHEISNGRYRYTDSGTGLLRLRQSGSNKTLTLNKTHKLTFEIFDNSAYMGFFTSGEALITYSTYTVGTHTVYFTPTASHTYFEIKPSSISASFSMDNVSLKEVTSNTGVLK